MATPCPCPPSFARARPRTALLVRDGATRKLRDHCRRNLVCQHRYTHATRPRRCGPPRRRALLYAPREHPLHAGSDTLLLGGTLHGKAAARHMAAAERSS